MVFLLKINHIANLAVIFGFKLIPERSCALARAYISPLSLYIISYYNIIKVGKVG